ncbi:MAG: hypothetical protein FE834_07065, partial [Gammaproteobacteria bacterium]|nr:hypothetical protein [Gammaproteobacteria bacterium]
GARYLAPWLARWISPDSAGAIEGLNLYVYVSNNPLKYIDPTGHMERESAQGAMEGGAVGGVGNNTTLVDFSRIKEVQQEILQSDMFRTLGALDSSSRFFRETNLIYPLPHHALEVEDRVINLRKDTDADIEKTMDTGASYLYAVMQSSMSPKTKDRVFNQYKVANCGECADIMFHALGDRYPDMVVEMISTPTHAFNLINRDQSISLFEPEQWNNTVLVVDAWAKTVHTQQEFLPVNAPDYNLSTESEGNFLILRRQANPKGMTGFELTGTAFTKRPPSPVLK